MTPTVEVCLIVCAAISVAGIVLSARCRKTGGKTKWRAVGLVGAIGMSAILSMEV